VALVPRGEYYAAESLFFDKPQAPPSPETVLARGQISMETGRSTPGSIRVLYGIEKYYVPEGTGNVRGKMAVRAAISDTGEVLIKEVLVDGKPYAQAAKEKK
jgi:hypothetical protein